MSTVKKTCTSRLRSPGQNFLVQPFRGFPTPSGLRYNIAAANAICRAAKSALSVSDLTHQAFSLSGRALGELGWRDSPAYSIALVCS